MPELTRRIVFTLGALLVYRLGLYILVPGIDPAAWNQIFRIHSTIGPLAPLFLAGGIHRLSIFGMGIVSYIAAAVVLQLATIVSPRLAALRQQGWRGRQIVVKRTRYLTLLFATLQACTVAFALTKANVASSPGLPFIFSTVVTLAAGTMFLVWLSDQITLRGLGNGIAVILFASLAAELPAAIAGTFMLHNAGVVSLSVTTVSIVTLLGLTVLIVFVEQARRRIALRFLPRQIGARSFDEFASYLPLKLNSAGIVPVMLASWLLFIVITLGGLLTPDSGSWLAALVKQVQPGRPTYLILYGLLILFFAFFYAALVLDPDRTVDALKNVQAEVVSVGPGESTAIHLDSIVSRTTAIGAGYLVLVCLLPELLLVMSGAPLMFGGAPLLVMICTSLDLGHQIREQPRL
jgi:preprotein translocase subunit SecY